MFAFVFLFSAGPLDDPAVPVRPAHGPGLEGDDPAGVLHLLAAMVVRQFGLPLWVLTLLSVGLFVAAGLIAVRSGGPNNRPRKYTRPLPVGLPEGVTYVPR